MIVGTDLWKPASQYAVLNRYFSLVKPTATPGAAAGPALRGPVASMASRIGAGLAYPFSSLTSLALLAAMFLAGIVPLLRFFTGIVAGIYSLAIIRTSSEGQTTAPSLGAVGGIGGWVMSFIRLVAVSIISAWAILVVMILEFTGMLRSNWFLLAAVVVTLFYYPASIATIAVWKRISIALSASQIVQFIGILGGDYYAVVFIWIASAVAFVGLELLASFGLPRMAVAVLHSVGTLFLLLYSAHLLGWAVHRHRDEL